MKDQRDERQEGVIKLNLAQKTFGRKSSPSYIIEELEINYSLKSYSCEALNLKLYRLRLIHASECLLYGFRFF